jgi:hypothetical protein
VEIVSLEYDDEDDYAQPEDTVPPVLTLNGATTVAVQQLSVYVDAGATAEDAVDGFVPVTASVECERGDGSGVIRGEVDTAEPTTCRVRYTAVDAAGNVAAAVARTVTVEALCAVPSFLCDQTLQCAVCEGDVCLCVPVSSTSPSAVCVRRRRMRGARSVRGHFAVATQRASTSIAPYVIRAGRSEGAGPDHCENPRRCWAAAGEEEATSAVEEYVPPVDSTPPVITMHLGSDGRWGNNSDGSTFVFHVVPQHGVFVDPGVTATDAEDGDLTAQVSELPHTPSLALLTR